MTNGPFADLFGPPRDPEGPLVQHHMDLAASVQAVTEEIVLRLGSTVHAETGQEHLCLAGGVALNCVANGRLLREGPFADVWVQPAAGDAGGAVGAALAVWHEHFGNARVCPVGDAMAGAFLGPQFSRADIIEALDAFGAVYHVFDPADAVDRAAELIAAGNVVGWFQGRMEFGPRALGARSILGDPRRPDMQEVMNLRIKFRESFRPFAPAVLVERAQDYFDIDRPSPYMLFTAAVQKSRRTPHAEVSRQDINAVRSDVPAVTHVDFSARVQTVDAATNPRFHALLKRFFERTGCAALINTSFNVRGEPIVASPADAYRCFMATDMDYLVAGDVVLEKAAQPHAAEKERWQVTYAPD